MDFTDVILSNLYKLNISDIWRIRNEIDIILEPSGMCKKAAEIKKEKGLLHSVKYVKEVTGWSLLDSKAYCDKLSILNI